MFKQIAIIGAGTMGYGIAFQFAQNNQNVILVDQSEDALVKAKEKIKKYAEIFHRKDPVHYPHANEIMKQLTFTTSLRDAAEADIVTECVVEILEVKQRLFKEMDELFPEDTIFVSNTSSLKLTDIIRDVQKHRSRSLLTHWFNPAHIVPLVELLQTDETDPAVYAKVKQFLTQCGKVTIDVKKELPGLVANRIQIAMAREVLSLLEDDVATKEDIDRAVAYGPGFRLAQSGLLEIMDFGGLDVWVKVMEQLQPAIASGIKEYPALESKVDAEKFGVKSGEGFFSYPNGSMDDYIFERDEKLIDQLLLKSKQQERV
ncbi:3-hydroxyacyl-CoA dehydrogenase family protein [Bacillus sp. CMF12]|uniref:3-hydroxyacyl-CoA dehydrogenase family protein n=1 Tax=Bacillus sp. CMF12 TaxID=2884834 RepID=UPI00207A9685|nr:3-hydroxyacyl-CoA dehydrogenase family protein [Bacillus sp. CMF12]USK47995.1 3-hydroxyacyl-CoA dehydrogenase family protein [Bacillus sp. CMF12]